MAKIRAFNAIRPVRNKVHLVATRPYYSYKKNVLKAKLEDNPYTFLHIINPEFGATIKTKPNSKERFLQVRQKFELFKQAGILQTDQSPHLYIYRQSKENFIVAGLIAGVSVDDYLNGSIKKHEQTITAREDVFTSYLDIVGFNAEPVLLTYEGSKDINSILAKQMNERAEFEFTTTDGITHELWLLNGKQSDDICTAFQQIPALYIADGHHRSASSARYTQQLRVSGKSFPQAANYFLGFLVEQAAVRIAAFHRLLKSANGINIEELILELNKSGNTEILKEPSLPSSKHDMHIYMAHTCIKYRPYLDECTTQDPVKSLDSDLLSEKILKPIFDIADLKTSKQIEFVAGNEPLLKIIENVDNNKFEIAFLLYPSSIEDIKKVADAGLNMPPKSTWVEPKLRSGLTIYSLEHD